MYKRSGKDTLLSNAEDSQFVLQFLETDSKTGHVFNIMQ